MKEIFELDDLLDAYVAAIRRPLYSLEAFRTFARHRATSLARCFGVSFGAEICAVLDRQAFVPDPFDGALEAGLLELRYEQELAPLRAAGDALLAFYRARAREIAQRTWGDVGTRTYAQLVAAGFEPSREPNLDDYVDEM